MAWNFQKIFFVKLGRLRMINTFLAENDRLFYCNMCNIILRPILAYFFNFICFIELDRSWKLLSSWIKKYAVIYGPVLIPRCQRVFSTWPAEAGRGAAPPCEQFDVGGRACAYTHVRKSVHDLKFGLEQCNVLASREILNLAQPSGTMHWNQRNNATCLLYGMAQDTSQRKIILL